MKLKKNRIWLGVIISVLVVIEGLSLFLMCKSLSDRPTFDDVRLKDQAPIDKNNTFAINVEQSDGSYKEQDTIPLKENGYIFNAEKSGCLDMNGNTLGNILSYRNNMIKVETTNTAFCYLYFDMISDGDFCIDQGITNFSECLLVMEDYSYDVGEATDYIASKGNVTTSAIAPTVKYYESSSNKKDTNGVFSTSTSIQIGSSYSFSATTGLYTLKSSSSATITDAHIGQYTCGNTGTSCAVMYKINAYTKTTGTTTTYKVTDADVYTFNVTDSFDSEVGLYKTTDADGDTYFYRGAVKNNYVSFGGYIWRIVRINGNGSVRMIYSGTSTSATGADASIGTSAYNSKYWDPTYVGYKYNDANLAYYENTTLTTYSNMNATAKYYYGSSFTYDASTRKFKLSGNTTSGVWSETYSTAIASYPYTCLSTSATGTCNFLLHLNSYVNATSAKIYYISYNSPNYAGTLTNSTDSTVKGVIDNWYATNIVGKKDDKNVLITNYISDEVFCNDRSVYDGSGYLMSPTTLYGAYNRMITTKKPTLLCSQASDKFSVANGNLTYPVALITIDEANLAGGIYGSVNSEYYLYTGQNYWTMSPSHFNSAGASAGVWSVNSAGQFFAYGTALALGVRPVINLKSDVLVTKGTGTADNPYIVSLS